MSIDTNQQLAVLTAEVERLRAANKLLADAIHPTRNDSWTAQSLASLATCHREDSIAVDDAEGYNQASVGAQLRAEVERLRHENEELKKRFEVVTGTVPQTSATEPECDLERQR